MIRKSNKPFSMAKKVSSALDARPVTSQNCLLITRDGSTPSRIHTIPRPTFVSEQQNQSKLTWTALICHCHGLHRTRNGPMWYGSRHLRISNCTISQIQV